MGLITSDQQTYYNPATDERISIDDAIAEGMVKAEKKEPESLSDSRVRARSQEAQVIFKMCLTLKILSLRRM